MLRAAEPKRSGDDGERMRRYLCVFCLAALVCSTLPAESVRAQASRPNIVHIFADDLG